MIIGIDGNEANSKRRVGAGQYAYNVLLELHRIDTKNKYYIYLKKKPQKDMPSQNKNWHYQIFGPKFMWTKLALPFKLYTQKIKLDLFFSLTHYSPSFCKVPTIPTIHDIGYLNFKDQFTKKDLYQLINWTKKSIRQAKAIVAVSQFTKNEIIKTYGIDKKKIFIAYNGVGQARSIPDRIESKILEKFKIEKPYFLYLGTLKPNKNIPFIIKSFYEYQRSNALTHQSSRLVIAGKKGWLFEDIFKLVTELKLEQQIIFTDFINETEKWALYKNAQALVIPSLYEGFGIPAIEAQKAKLPVIASNIDVYKEILNNSAILINPYKQVELIKALNDIQKDSLADKLIKAGLKNSTKFTWTNTAKSILKCFYDTKNI
jgi:glycosyltransferase involved in cell wall biosynthesis